MLLGARRTESRCLLHGPVTSYRNGSLWAPERKWPNAIPLKRKPGRSVLAGKYELSWHRATWHLRQTRHRKGLTVKLRLCLKQLESCQMLRQVLSGRDFSSAAETQRAGLSKPPLCLPQTASTMAPVQYFLSAGRSHRMHPLEFTGTKVPIKVNEEMKGLYRTI